MRGSCFSHPYFSCLQKYIAQVLQDSEVDGDGDGAPGSSGDEPPSSSSQDEELLMPPDGLTDTDFQSCEDSLIENEIHQSGEGGPWRPHPAPLTPPPRTLNR
jgi:hypothetical protein